MEVAYLFFKSLFEPISNHNSRMEVLVRHGGEEAKKTGFPLQNNFQAISKLIAVVLNSQI